MIQKKTQKRSNSQCYTKWKTHPKFDWVNLVYKESDLCPGAAAISRSPLLGWGVSLVQPPSPCWYIHQCPPLNNALHKPLRKTAQNFGRLPFEAVPKSSHSKKEMFHSLFDLLFFFFSRYIRSKGKSPSLKPPTRTNTSATLGWRGRRG